MQDYKFGIYNKPGISKANANVGKEVIVNQWPMGGWGSVLGEGFDDDTAEEKKFVMASNFGE